MENDHKQAAEQLFKQLSLLTLVGCGRQIIGAMLSLGMQTSSLPPLPVNKMRFLTGPIIVHTRSGDDLGSNPIKSNANFKGQIYSDRLKWALGLTEMSVGPTEMAMVMYQASLEAPFTHDMAQLYIWASKAAIRAQVGPGQPALDGIDSPLEGEAPEKILSHPSLKYLYRDLAADIQRKVINQMIGAEKTQRSKAA
jgi:hypothetical protein